VDEAAHVFERFYRAEGLGARRGGIGPVHLQRHRCRARWSNLGGIRRTWPRQRVLLHLPVGACEPNYEELEHARAESSSCRSPKHAGSQRILVVDDDATILGLVHDCAAEEGYEVDTAADGLRGLGETPFSATRCDSAHLTEDACHGRWTFIGVPEGP